MNEQKKICTNCNLEKDINEFRCKRRKTTIYYELKCKKCCYIISKNRLNDLKNININKYNDLINKRKKRDKKYYSNNKEKINKRNNEYYDKNKKSIQLKRKLYRKNNPDQIKKWKNSYRDSINGKLASNYRRRIRKEIGSGKKYLEYLDCDINHLKKWFEFNFQIDQHLNFTWNNYGNRWTIDHVMPCRSFDLTNIDEVRKCFNWKNTIPVGKKYNQVKTGKIKKIDLIKLELRLKLFKNKLTSQGIK